MKCQGKDDDTNKPKSNNCMEITCGNDEGDVTVVALVIYIFRVVKNVKVLCEEYPAYWKERNIFLANE